MAKKSQENSPKRKPTKKLAKLGSRKTTTFKKVTEQVPEWLATLLAKHGEAPGTLVGLEDAYSESFSPSPPDDVDPEEAAQLTNLLEQMGDEPDPTTQEREATSVEWGDYKAESEEPPPAIDDLLANISGEQGATPPEDLSEDAPAWLSGIVSESQAPPEAEMDDEADDQAALDETPDWLNEISPSKQTTILSPSPEEEAPSWLSDEPDAPGEPSPVGTRLLPPDETPPASTEDVDVPDWLSEALEQPPASEPTTPADSGETTDADADVPDWLNEALDEPSAAAPIGTRLLPAEETPPDFAEETDVPDWLSEAEDQPTPPQPDSSAAETTGDIPDWLSDTLDEPEFGQTPAELDEPTADDTAGDDIPEWLQSDTPTAQTPAAVDEETDVDIDVPDWLSEIAPESEEDVEESADLDDDWLSEFRTAAEESAQSPPSELSADVGDSDDWLAYLEETAETETETTPSQETLDPADTGWLTALDDLPDLEETQESTSRPTSPQPADTGWLADIGAPPNAEAEVTELETPTPSEEDDWLAGGDLRTTTPETEQDEDRSDTEEFPDWLTETTPPPLAETPEPESSAEAIPDWLTESPAPASDQMPETETEGTSSDWLAGALASSEETPPSEPEEPDWLSSIRETSTSAEQESEPSELPDWLTDTFSEEDDDETAADSDGSAIPDWLFDAPDGAETAAPEAEAQQTAAEAGPEEVTEDTALETPDWLADEPDLPDWLSDEEPDTPDWFTDTDEPAKQELSWPNRETAEAAPGPADIVDTGALSTGSLGSIQPDPDDVPEVIEIDLSQEDIELEEIELPWDSDDEPDDQPSLSGSPTAPAETVEAAEPETSAAAESPEDVEAESSIEIEDDLEMPGWLDQLQPADEAPNLEDTSGMDSLFNAEELTLEPSPQDDLEMPDWLSDLPSMDANQTPDLESAPDIEAAAGPEPGQPSAEATDDDLEMPAWLADLPSIDEESIDERESRGETVEAMSIAVDDALDAPTPPVETEEVETSDEPAETEDDLEMPAWLADLPGDAEPAAPTLEAEEVETPETEDELQIPGWLGDLPDHAEPAAPTLEAEEVETSDEPAETEDDLEMPAWLADLPADAESAAPTLEAEEVETPETEDELQIPGWLGDLPDHTEPAAPTLEAEEVETPETEDELQIPGWLGDLPGDTEPAAPTLEAEEVETPETDDELHIPGWLGDLPDHTEPVAPPLDTEETETPDETAETDDDDLEMPAWLAGLPPTPEGDDEPALPFEVDEIESPAEAEDQLDMPAWLSDLPSPQEETSIESLDLLEVDFDEDLEEDTPLPGESRSEIAGDEPAWIAGLREATGGRIDVSQFQSETQSPADTPSPSEAETMQPELEPETPEAAPPITTEPEQFSAEVSPPDEEVIDLDTFPDDDDELVMPDWLTQSPGPDAASRSEDATGALPPLTDEIEDTPGALSEDDDPDHAVIDFAAAPPAPDWLADDLESGETAPPEDQAEVAEETQPAESETDDIPEWLAAAGALAAAEATEGLDTESEVVETEGKKEDQEDQASPSQPVEAERDPSEEAVVEDEVEDEVKEEKSEDDDEELIIPDWLAQELSGDLETPDWLSDAEGPDDGETRQSSLLAGEPPPAPDWLTNFEESGTDDDRPGSSSEAVAAVPTSAGSEEFLTPDIADAPSEEQISDEAHHTEPTDEAPAAVDDDTLLAAGLAGLAVRDRLSEQEAEKAEKAPSWLDALKPGAESPPDDDDRQTTEATGMLAGLGTLMPAERVSVPSPLTGDQDDDLRKAADQFQAIATQAPQPATLPPLLTWPQQLTGRAIRAILLLLFIGLIAIPLFPAVQKTVEGQRVAWTEPVGRFSEVLDNQRRQLISEQLGIIDVQQPDSVALVSFDYSPATAGEMQPLAEAVLGRLKGQGMRIIAVSLDPEGPAMAQQTIDRVLAERNQQDQYGLDIVNLGYLPGQVAAVRTLAAGQQFATLTDFKNATPFGDSRPSNWEDVENLSQVDLVATFADNPASARWWVEQLQIAPQPDSGERFVLAATSAVADPFLRPYRDNDQLDGLISGVNGAAAIEAVRNNYGLARSMIDSQSIAHLIIVILIAVGTMIGWMPTEPPPETKSSKTTAPKAKKPQQTVESEPEES